MSDVSRARAAYIRAVVAERRAKSRLIFRRKQGRKALKLRRLLARKRLDRRKAKRSYLAARLRANRPLRAKALDEAVALIGVMESGGNNRGEKVTQIIRANGGTGPEPWCGDFVAYCYRLAGSKAVDRRWAAVRLLSLVSGVRRTTNPQPGDLVRFTFDHVGIFSKRVNGSTIEVIEGNTGASGAVSDSSTGGDGVYRKNRSTSLVADYLRVTR